MNNVLILTATVTPSLGQIDLVMTNPIHRFNEYLSALKFYIELSARHNFQIIFVENSGFDLSLFSNRLPPSNIIYYSAERVSNLEGSHRGWAEFLMLNEVYDKFLCDLKEDEKVFKITGRYIVKNFHQFLSASPKIFDIYCDSKKGWIELSVIAWSIKGWRSYIVPLIPYLRQSSPPETIFYQHLERIKNESIVAHYYCPPIIDGVRGASGIAYRGRLWILRYIRSYTKGMLIKFGLLKKGL